MKKNILPLVFIVIGVGSLAAYFFFRPKPVPLPMPVPTPEASSPVVSDEEKRIEAEAHALGTRLYNTAVETEREVAAQPVVPEVTREEKFHKVMQPVYEDIEGFILRQLMAYSNRVDSVFVFYKGSGVFCTIFIHPCPEVEMREIKGISQGFLGKIVQNLPMVQYLIIRNKKPGAPKPTAADVDGSPLSQPVTKP